MYVILDASPPRTGIAAKIDHHRRLIASPDDRAFHGWFPFAAGLLTDEVVDVVLWGSRPTVRLRVLPTQQLKEGMIAVEKRSVLLEPPASDDAT